MYLLIKVILLGIVEGVTEFLPVSSTGHLLLCEHWMGIDLDSEFWKTFAIFIQIGAIAAVVVYFRTRIRDLLLGRHARADVATPLEIAATAQAGSTILAAADATHTADSAAGEIVLTDADRRRAVYMILLATIPVLVIGFFTHKWVEEHLERPGVIATVLAVGGALMIVIELLPTNVTTRRIERISHLQAIGIGCAQVLAAVFPGTSRSAATIMGGLLAGLSREAATEFSFFLAIPAMFAACGYSLLKYLRHAHPTMQEILLLVIGTLVSFLVAWVVIAAFMNYVRRHNFIPFAVYRILLAAIVVFTV